jgi:hypothetical protein
MSMRRKYVVHVRRLTDRSVTTRMKLNRKPEHDRTRFVMRMYCVNRELLRMAVEKFDTLLSIWNEDDKRQWRRKMIVRLLMCSRIDLVQKGTQTQTTMPMRKTKGNDSAWVDSIRWKQEACNLTSINNNVDRVIVSLHSEHPWNTMQRSRDDNEKKKKMYAIGKTFLS